MTQEDQHSGSPTTDAPQSDEDGPSRSSDGLDLVIRIDQPSWQAAVADLDGVVQRAATAALTPFEHGAVDLSVVLADDAAVRALNRDHRGKDKATNVLSFPAAFSEPDGAEQLGDVILAFETVRDEAQAQEKALSDHLTHLVVHGVLHLMGLDHETAEEAEDMEALERDLLAGLGIADPYTDPLDTEPSESRVDLRQSGQAA
jgi:probable rRNA maturation factor